MGTALGQNTGFKVYLGQYNPIGLWAWGSNGYGQLGDGTTNNSAVPIQISSSSSIAKIAGGNSSAYIKTDGTLWAWGLNNNGQLGNGTTISYSSPIQIGSLTNWSQIALGLAHLLSVKTDGTLWVCGYNNSGQLGNGTTVKYSSPIQIGSLTDWSYAAGGNYYTAAIKTDGTLWAWGSDAYGNLGNGVAGATVKYSSPIQVGALTNWYKLSVGAAHWAAIKTDGTLWVCGYGGAGQLGNGTTVSYSSPIQIGSLTNWSQVAAGSVHATAAIKTDGTLWTWGGNANGGLGNGTTISYSSPIQIGSLTNWSQITYEPHSSNLTLFGLKTDGTIWTCGYNSYGSMGNGTTIKYSSPVQVGSLNTWTSIAHGSGHLFAVSGSANVNVQQDLGERYVSKDYLIDVYPNIASNAGARTSPGLWTWGRNNFGKLGNGTTTNYSSPIQIGSLTNWKQVVLGFNAHIAAIKTDGTLWTCGYNGQGELGNGTITNYSSPIQIGSLTNWKQVSAGQYHTQAIKTDGTLWSWGYGFYGQLGNGARVNYSSPIQIGSLTNWKQVSSGIFHFAATKTDGTLWTCGYNSNGQLGNGTTISYSSPIQVGSLTNWKQVSSGNYNVAAIKTDGTLWSWGNDAYGQLGNGTTIHYSSPIQIGSLTNWKQVSFAAGIISSAIKTDGTLWAWGYNATGALGNGSTINYSSPIQIGSLTNWKQVANAGNFIAAIKTDGTLWAWGSNGYGAVGNGSTINYSSPIQIGSLTSWKQVFCGYASTITIADGYY